jgi:hypothetical protein
MQIYVCDDTGISIKCCLIMKEQHLRFYDCALTKFSGCFFTTGIINYKGTVSRGFKLVLYGVLLNSIRGDIINTFPFDI